MPLGTIGSLKLLKNQLTENFFSINCDIIINHNLKEIYDFHTSNNYDLTIVTSIKNFEIPYGVCETNSKGVLKNFLEKPSYDLFVNTGLYVFKKSTINFIPRNQNFDIQKLIEFHKREKRKATLTAVNPPGRFGSLEFERGRVLSFKEKPKGDGNMINGGFFVVNTEVIDLIDNDNCVWEKDVLPHLASRGQLNAFKHNDFWQPMDTLRDKNYLNELWLQKKGTRTPKIAFFVEF